MTKAQSSLTRLRDDLRDVRAAIKRVEGGFQSATSAGGSATDSYTNLPLSVLYERENELLRRISAKKNKGRAFSTIKTRFY